MIFSKVGTEKLNVPVLRHVTYGKDIHTRSRSCPVDWFTLKIKALQSLKCQELFTKNTALHCSKANIHKKKFSLRLQMSDSSKFSTDVSEELPQQCGYLPVTNSAPYCMSLKHVNIGAQCCATVRTWCLSSRHPLWYTYTLWVAIFKDTAKDMLNLTTFFGNARALHNITQLHIMHKRFR